MKKSSLVLAPLASLFLLGCIGMQAEAAEKKWNVNLTKEYQELTLSIEFEDENESRNILITKPDGTELKGKSVEQYYSVDIQNAPSGMYIISVEADEEIIGTPSAYGTSAVQTDDTSSVSVSSVITGLEYYFSDSILNVDWSSEVNASVNIKITNPSTMQVLANDTANGGHYERRLPDAVKTIELFVVAAQDVKDETAGITYTLDVVRDIPGEIDVPENYLTNSDYYTIGAHLEEDLTIAVYDNDSLVYTEELIAGDHGDITFELTSVQNNITVYVIDADGNRKSVSFVVNKDVVAPELSLDNLDGKVYSSNSVDIAGFATGGASNVKITWVADAEGASVHEEEIPMDSNGAFEKVVPLLLGGNTVTVSAYDAAGNVSSSQFFITRVETQERKANPIYFLAAVLSFVFAFLFLALNLRIRKKLAPMEEQLKQSKKYTNALYKKYSEKNRGRKS